MNTMKNGSRIRDPINERRIYLLEGEDGNYLNQIGHIIMPRTTP